MIPRVPIAPGYEIARIIKGGWHLAGGHGHVDRAQAKRDMASFVDAGINTFDCADIYTDVEALIGEFLAEYPAQAKAVQVHTKYVPNLQDLASVGRADVERVIDRSLKRLGTERLDLVQFHWWDYQIPRYVEVGRELERQRQLGKIRHLGVTNFDVVHLRELVDAGVKVIGHQLQYSLIDPRPDHGMKAYCLEQGIALLCYGTVAGGFLSERWVGKPEPTGELANRSLVKYKLIIDDFGGWVAFQELLKVLAVIAQRHGCGIASVATRMILDRHGVAAAIVGATNSSHLAEHTKLGGLKLTSEDFRAIDLIVGSRKGPVGDVYALERDRNGRHGRIIKYDLNE